MKSATKRSAAGGKAMKLSLGATGRKESGSLLNTPVAMAFVAIPHEVTWSYFAFGVVIAIGLVTILVRGDWQKARGFDKLILFGPLFYAAPLAAFGTEHLTLTKVIASLVTKWIPWHLFWAYLVGVCFIAAALSLVTRIQARLAARLLGFTFFLFVVARSRPTHPGDDCVLLRLDSRAVLQLRTIHARRLRSRHSAENGNSPMGLWPHHLDVPGGIVYAVAALLLLIGKRTRAAATWLGLTVLFVVLVVYVPIGVIERASIEGFNYLADTLMYCGAVLLLAGAMPREA